VPRRVAVLREDILILCFFSAKGKTHYKWFKISLAHVKILKFRPNASLHRSTIRYKNEIASLYKIVFKTDSFHFKVNCLRYSLKLFRDPVMQIQCCGCINLINGSGSDSGFGSGSWYLWQCPSRRQKP
jgi:hypothetical protein